MLGITELKTGTVFELEGHPWQVLEYQHSKMGRGGAVLKTKIKNLATGVIVSRTFQGSEKFEGVQLERKKAQYLYADEVGHVFMDQDSYEQFTLGNDVAGEAVKYINEGDSIELQLYKGSPIAVTVPIKVKLKITEAEPADKGNTTGSATKPVKLETGITVHGPLFLKVGDSVIVDTRTGTYVERAN